MKTKRVALLTASLVIVLCAVIIVGATFALFGKTVNRNVTVTTGDVSIEAEFGVNPTLFSLVEGNQEKLQSNDTFQLGGKVAYNAENATLELTNVVPGDKAEITLTVKNTSSVEILYCVDYAITNANGIEISIDSASQGERNWSKLAVGGTADITITVELPADATDQSGSEGTAQSTIAFTVYAGQSNASTDDLEEIFHLN